MSPVPVRPALLIALRRHGEGYGLQIIDWIREDTGGGLVFAQGAVYPALHSLEAEGLLASRASDPLPERGGRPRIYYQLTHQGQRVASEAMDVLKSITGFIPQGAST